MKSVQSRVVLLAFITSCVTWYSVRSTIIDIRDYRYDQHQHGYLGAAGLNVTGAWQQCITGEGVTVAVVDDNVYQRHPELRHAVEPSQQYRRVRSPNRLHGTMSAGVIFASPSVDQCGVGVAFNATLQVRSLPSVSAYPGQSRENDQGEAAVLSWSSRQWGSNPDVFLCGWGPPETNFHLGRMPGDVKQALHSGVTQGRSGRGVVYVWAAGNGGITGNSCAYDGYVNNRYTVAVAGVTREGRRLRSGERCSAIMAATPSQDNGESRGFPTTDGINGCYHSFSDSSLASALGAGVLALALQANPRLTWRDMQHLIAETSTVTDREGGAWITNYAGKNVSPYLGFGRLNAGRLVSRARTWASVASEISCTAHAHNHFLVLHQLPTRITILLRSDCQITSLEHVTTHVELSGLAARGHVSLDLKHRIHWHRGTATISNLLPGRRTDVFSTQLEWDVDSLAFWGENPRSGDWSLHFAKKFQGTLPHSTDTSNVYLRNVTVTFYGTGPGRRTPTYNPPAETCQINSRQSPRQWNQNGQQDRGSFRFVYRASNRLLIISDDQYTIRQVTNARSCRQLCLTHSRCRSLTYFHSTQRCSLNTVAYSDHSVRSRPYRDGLTAIYDKVPI